LVEFGGLRYAASVAIAAWPFTFGVELFSMPEQDLKKTKTDELLARVDEVVKQAQSLRTDISTRMRQQRAHDRSVTQPLSPRKMPRKRQN
jgi:hypothetical protein